MEMFTLLVGDCKRRIIASLDFIFTARSVDKCLSAVEKLEKLGLKPCYHELDVESADSVNSFAKFIGEKYGGVDILVNNAAILLKVIELSIRLLILF